MDAVRRALHKLDANAEAALDATDGMGRTLLHVCAATPLRSGTEEVVQMLLSHRARPCVPDANDRTPLALSLAAVASDKATSATLATATAVISSLLHARAEVAGRVSSLFLLSSCTDLSCVECVHEFPWC